MKIAAAVWNGRISPVFDVAGRVLVLEVEGGQRRGHQEEPLPESPASKTERLAELHVDTLVCGAISRPLAGMLAMRGIRVIAFIAGDADEVIRAYLGGELQGPMFAMPGCCGRRRRSRGRRH